MSADPVPVIRRQPTLRDVAEKIASEWNERGHDLSASDVLALVADWHAALVLEYGRACIGSGRVAR